MQGAILQRDTTHEASKVLLQWSTNDEEWNQLNIPFLDAMYLLNLLKAIQIDAEYEMPES